MKSVSAGSIVHTECLSSLPPSHSICILANVRAYSIVFDIFVMQMYVSPHLHIQW